MKTDYSHISIHLYHLIGVVTPAAEDRSRAPFPILAAASCPSGSGAGLPMRPSAGRGIGCPRSADWPLLGLLYQIPHSCWACGF